MAHGQSCRPRRSQGRGGPRASWRAHRTGRPDHLGRSAINQAPITGESLPVEKAEGDQVFAGTINETGSFEYKVTAGASDSTLARIIHAVESAQGSRAPTQLRRPVRPRLHAGGVRGPCWLPSCRRSPSAAHGLTGLQGPGTAGDRLPLRSGHLHAGHHRQRLGRCRRRGILIKGGVYLEGGRKLKALALDKTGTLTHGKPEQTDFVPLIGEAQEAAAWPQPRGTLGPSCVSGHRPQGEP
jgi:Cd2+/Zn2+-exporting ATPase